VFTWTVLVPPHRTAVSSHHCTASEGSLTCIKGMNEWINDTQVHLIFVFHFSLATQYQHYSKSIPRESTDRRRRTRSNRVGCRAMDIPMRSLPCFERLLPHATAAVEDGTTTAQYSPLHHHSNHRLRLRHTIVSWRGPHPLPLTGRLTDRWSPRTRCLSMESEGETVCRPWLGLPQPGCTGPRALVIEPSGGGKRREEEEDECRITVVTGPVGALVTRRTTRISIGPQGWPQGPLAPRTEPSPPP
jgi:hypothetical protein